MDRALALAKAEALAEGTRLVRDALRTMQKSRYDDIDPHRKATVEAELNIASHAVSNAIQRLVEEGLLQPE